MSDTPLLPPCPAGDRRLRNPWSLALHLYRTDPVWRGAIDIVWIGTAVAVLTFGMPDLLPDWLRSPAPPQSAASAVRNSWNRKGFYRAYLHCIQAYEDMEGADQPCGRPWYGILPKRYFGYKQL